MSQSQKKEGRKERTSVYSSREFKAETTILALFDKYCQKRQFFFDKLLIQPNFVDLIRKKMSKVLLRRKIILYKRFFGF